MVNVSEIILLYLHKHEHTNNARLMGFIVIIQTYNTDLLFQILILICKYSIVFYKLIEIIFNILECSHYSHYLCVYVHLKSTRGRALILVIMPAVQRHVVSLIALPSQFMCIICSHCSVTFCFRVFVCFGFVVCHLLVRPEELVRVRATELGDERDVQNHLGVNEGTQVSFPNT